MVLNELGEEVDVYHKKFGKACCRFPEMLIGDVLFEGVGLGSRYEGCTGWEQEGAHLST